MCALLPTHEWFSSRTAYVDAYEGHPTFTVQTDLVLGDPHADHATIGRTELDGGDVVAIGRPVDGKDGRSRFRACISGNLRA